MSTLEIILGKSSMPEVFSTVGLVTDVTEVLILITLSHVEAGMPIPLVNRQSPWGSFKTRVGRLWTDYPWICSRVNSTCVLALFVGTGLMVAGIWMGQCCATAEEAPTPIAPPPTRPSPSEIDLMCEDAVAEMRRLIEKGGRNISYYDPRGQLASLVETCIKSGRGG